MKVPQFVLDDFLEPYTSSSKYLIYAEIKDNITYGLFSVHQRSYAREEFNPDYLTFQDSIHCINQLAYVSFAERIRKKSIPKLNELSYDYFKNTILFDGKIAEVEKLKFKKPIKQKLFSGHMKDKQIRKLNNSIHIFSTFNFENSAFGNIKYNINLKIKRN